MLLQSNTARFGDKVVRKERAMTRKEVANSRVSPGESRDIVSPERLDERTPAHLVGDMHAAFGRHAARAVHAKGIIATGRFIPSPDALSLCRANLFEAERPIIVRFSDFTGLPDIPDYDPRGQPRGMAIKFLLPDGGNYDLVCHSFNGFPVANAAEFGELLLAIGSSGPGAPSPTKLELFLAAHPRAQHFLTNQTPPPQSYATTGYYGVNACQLTGPGGAIAYVRYRVMPVAGEHYLDAARLAERDADYLAEEMQARVSAGAVDFMWLAQIAEDGDPIEDPSAPWPDTRRLVPLGILRIEALTPPSTHVDRSLFFLPGTTPPGIAVADPMLTIRNAAYPSSYAHRTGQG